MDGAARVTVYLEMKANQFKTALTEAKNRLNGTVQELKDKLSSLKTNHIEAFSAMKDEVPGLGRAVELVTNPYILLTAAVVALGAAFSKASAMAQEFDSNMAKANVTLNLDKPGLEKAKGQVLDIASRSTTKNAVQEAPEALNIFASANLSDDAAENAKLAMAAVEPALKAAKFGYTDVATAARAASLAMNASGIKDANKIYDVFAATLNKGNAEFGTIAQYLPKLIAQANTAGISFEETAGAYAFMTQKFTGEKSATMLENIINTLQNSKITDKFKELGVNVYDAQHKMRPLVDIAKDLGGVLTGLSDEKKNGILNSLGMDTESQTGFAAMIQNVDGLKSSIDATTNSAGQADIAFKNAQTPMDGWTQISNAISVQWVKLGEAINRIILGPLGDFFSKIFKNILDGTSSVSPLITSIKTTFMDIYTVVSEALTPVLQGMGIIFGAIWDTAVSITTAIWSFIEPIFAWFAKSVLIKDIFWGIGQLIKGIAWALGKLVEGIGWAFSKIGEGIAWVYDHTIKPILDGIEWIYTKVKSILGFHSDNSSVNKAKEALKETMPGVPEIPKKPDNLLKPTLSPKGTPDGKGEPKDKGGKDAGGVSSQSTTRVININKLSVVDGNFISASPEISGMGKSELEAWFEQMVTRAMVNLGRSYN